MSPFEEFFELHSRAMEGGKDENGLRRAIF
jgi:hypothetical protein